MKKYIQPELTVVAVNLQTLICNSVTEVTGLDGVEMSNEDFEGGAVDSRRKDVWDDEEEDDAEF